MLELLQAWPLKELDILFQGKLPEMKIDECRIPASSRRRKFNDCLREGQSVKALTIDVTANLVLNC